jgi:hypothetical protein
MRTSSANALILLSWAAGVGTAASIPSCIPPACREEFTEVPDGTYDLPRAFLDEHELTLATVRVSGTTVTVTFASGGTRSEGVFHRSESP